MKLALLFVFCFGLFRLWAQVQDRVDFIRAEVFAEPLPETKQLQGKVTYTFQVLREVDSIFLDAQALHVAAVLLDAKPIPFTNTGKTIVIRHPFTPGNQHFLTITYTATPQQTLYFVGWEDNDPSNNQVWTQGQGKYTSHWLPSFDTMNEKVVFDLQIRADTAYTVVANGKLAEIHTEGDTATWKYTMQNPMSSYLVAFAIGKFAEKIIHASSGVPIYLYYTPKDSLKAEPTYRYTQHIFDFLEQEIGVPYPWQNYKQVPVQDFLYAGMENTGATFFSNNFMIDSTAFIDKNYVNTNAHELAHQWFGNWVTEQSETHHWLHEGFATYYAYLAEREIFGADAFYWRLWETAQALTHLSQEGQGEALTQPAAGSLTLYEKGAWALVLLREKIGDTNFVQGIQHYITTYAGKNATIQEFIAEMETTANVTLTTFTKQWLYSPGFPWEEAKAFLETHSPSLVTYKKLVEEINTTPANAEVVLQRKWPHLQSQSLKYRLILEYGRTLSPGFIATLLQTEELKIRQAVALALENIPPELQTEFETLLDDKSYVTVAAALYKLWMQFPHQRAVYLNHTEGRVGFPNKNLQLLWLTLAQATPSYRPHEKPHYFKMLNEYTNPQYAFEVRWLAFQYLTPDGRLTNKTLTNLVNACTHPAWHFKKACRALLKTLLEEKENTAQLRILYPSLTEEEQHYVNQILNL